MVVHRRYLSQTQCIVLDRREPRRPVHGLVAGRRAARSSATSRRRRASPSSSACGASRSRRAAIFGPLTYGAVTWIFAGNHRLAIFATGVYFVVGLALLAGIDVERGRRQALAA